MSAPFINRSCGWQPSVQQSELHYYLPPSASSPAVDAGKLLTSDDHRDTQRLPIHNIRGCEHEFNVDHNGFCLVRHTSALKTFDDHNRICQQYYPEVEALLKQEFPAATEILLHPYVIRGAPDPRRPFYSPSTSSAPTNRPPPRVHVDFTPSSALAATAAAVPVFKPSTISFRRSISLHVWRPIHNPVFRDALCVVDGSTVSSSDLVTVPKPDGGEMIFVKAAPQRHKWFWLSEQTPDEVWIIKLSDSDEGKAGVVPSAPHSSFKPWGSEVGEVPVRRSIEVSALVVF